MYSRAWIGRIASSRAMAVGLATAPLDRTADEFKQALRTYEQVGSLREGTAAGGKSCRSPPLADGDVDACGASARPESSSKWTPELLAAEMRKLPVHALFPALCEEIEEVLARWHRRFPLKIWKRMVKIQEGAAHQVPALLKELNESAPVICKVRSWVAALPPSSPAAYVLDVGAGYGFLSMFLAELLPPDRVRRCILVDACFPNLGVEASEGGISTEHVYRCGDWRIPLHTLKVDLKKGRALNNMAERVLKAPAEEGAGAGPAPAFLCGVHLCNTLGLRAAQLFNEHPEVAGLALVPCCFPTQRHLAQQVVYQLGSHRFAAEEVLNAKVLPSSTQRFARWAEHIVEGLEPGPGGCKALERHALHRPRSAKMFAQDVYIFAERAPGRRPSAPCSSAVATGGAVVVDAEFGHANARKHKVRAPKRAAPPGGQLAPDVDPGE